MYLWCLLFPVIHGVSLYSPQQWFNLFAPNRLAIDTSSLENRGSEQGQVAERTAANLPFNTLDVNKLLKGKSDRGKSKQSQAKKPPVGKTHNPGLSRGGQAGKSWLR